MYVYVYVFSPMILILGVPVREAFKKIKWMDISTPPALLPPPPKVLKISGKSAKAQKTPFSTHF